MQIINLNLDRYNFYCPATGAQITSSTTCDGSPATLAIWHDEIISDPTILNKDIEEKWNAYNHSLGEDDWIELEDFLQSLEGENLICFAITTHGVACGPISSTTWYLIDMDYHDEIK
jgi:hypothetical protein